MISMMIMGVEFFIWSLTNSSLVLPSPKRYERLRNIRLAFLSVLNIYIQALS